MKLASFSFVSMLCASIVAIAGPMASAQTSLFSKEAEQKAQTLLKQMTIDEKIGQLNESSGIVMPGIATEKPWVVIYPLTRTDKAGLMGVQQQSGRYLTAVLRLSHVLHPGEGLISSTRPAEFHYR